METLCECGCGSPAPIATKTNTRYGHIKGQPLRFINGHNCKGENNSAWKPLADRFWKKVNKEGPTLRSELGPCWVWIGGKNKNGYGIMHVSGRGCTCTHRVAWFLETGTWPRPNALHKCDNPACVRFSHLFEGDQKTNVNDMTCKGRHGRAKLSEHDIAEICALHNSKRKQEDIAAIYGIAASTVWRIINGLSWKHVPRKPPQSVKGVDIRNRRSQ